MYKNSTAKSSIFITIITIILFFIFPKFEISGSLIPKVSAMIFSIGAIVYTLINKPQNKTINLVVLVTSIYALWFGISTLYANSGKFAISEYIKILIGFSIFLLAVYTKDAKDILKKILWAITSFTGAVTLLSIEGASLGIIAPIFQKMTYGGVVAEIASFNGERISSIYASVNPFATLIGITLFISLYLFLNATTKLEKYIQGFFIVLFANGIFLVFSMGGTFSLGISCLAFLIFAQKDLRTKGFFVIIESALIGFITTLLTINTYVKASSVQHSSGSIIPLLAIFIGTVIFIALNLFVNQKLENLVVKYSKKVFIILGVMTLVGLVGVLFIFSQKQGSVIAPSEVYTRVLYLEPGIYEAEFKFENDSDSATFQVITKTLEQVILGESQLLSSTPNTTNSSEKITFEIPENIYEVNFRLINTSEINVKLNYVRFVGDKTVDVLLSYKYIPDNITQRLQGLGTNNSLITRIQYNKDSLLLFAKSPIIGHGLGGFENAIQSVQKYQYETKYAHNHFAQTLVDGGIIGVVSYISMLASCIFVLIKSRKENDLAPMLIGSLTMIIVHGATEFSMSIAHIVPVAFVIFAIVSISCDVEVSEILKFDTHIFVGEVLVMSLLTIFLTGNVIAKANIDGGSVTLDTLVSCTNLDIYEKNDYMLSYVLSTSGINDANIRKTSDKYLKKLEKAKSNTISKYLTTYYLQKNDNQKALEQIIQYIDYSIYDSDTWNSVITMYVETLLDMQNLGNYYSARIEHTSNIDMIISKLKETNKETISEIVLDDTTLNYVRIVYAGNDIEDMGEFMSYVSNVIYDSKYDTDINQDGWYDGMFKYSGYNNLLEDDIIGENSIFRVKVPYSEDAMYKIVYEDDNIQRISAPQDNLDLEVVDGKTIAYIDTINIPSMTNSTEGYMDIVFTIEGELKKSPRIIISTKDFEY